ncbi:MAG: hypothetical protein HY673_14190 [Chloroflexi bacterium]|nr:hypothetical protein [Chloroflexota bacterium]
MLRWLSRRFHGLADWAECIADRLADWSHELRRMRREGWWNRLADRTVPDHSLWLYWNDPDSVLSNFTAALRYHYLPILIQWATAEPGFYKRQTDLKEELNQQFYGDVSPAEKADEELDKADGTG